MLRCLVLGGLFLLAACGPTAAPTAETGPSRNSGVPTLPPPEWTEAAGPVSLDNITRISYLGRLDAPGAPSTLFTYDFSPDGTRLAALNNEQLLAWNLVTGDLLFSTGRLEATEVYFSPDKTEVYTLGQDSIAQVYDADTGINKNSFKAYPHTENISTFHDDAGWLAVGGRDGGVKVWDTYTRQSLVTIDAYEHRLTALAFSPDGERLATADIGGIVRVWQWRERQEIAAFDQQGAAVTRMTFAPDGDHLVVGAGEFIAQWSLATQELDFALETGAGSANDVLDYSPDGRFLINGGATPDMHIWDRETGNPVVALPGIGGDRISAAFSPDGNLLLTSVLDGPVTLWDLSRITEETVNRADLDVGSERILFVDWTNDGFLLTFFDATGPVYLWGDAGEETAEE